MFLNGIGLDDAWRLYQSFCQVMKDSPLSSKLYILNIQPFQEIIFQYIDISSDWIDLPNNKS